MIRQVSLVVVLGALLLAASACSETDTGSVTIDSDPAGATIMVDGETRGTTPKTFNLVPEGSFEVTLQLDGHQPKTVKVSVPAGGRVIVSQSLIPISRLEILRQQALSDGMISASEAKRLIIGSAAYADEESTFLPNDGRFVYVFGWTCEKADIDMWMLETATPRYEDDVFKGLMARVYYSVNKKTAQLYQYANWEGGLIPIDQNGKNLDGFISCM